MFKITESINGLERYLYDNRRNDLSVCFAYKDYKQKSASPLTLDQLIQCITYLDKTKYIQYVPQATFQELDDEFIFAVVLNPLLIEEVENQIS